MGRRRRQVLPRNRPPQRATVAPATGLSLSLHPDKTRLIEFGRHAAADHKKRGVGRPETFAFLGFTFICGKSRRGAFQLQRKTRARPHAGEAPGNLNIQKKSKYHNP
jgi:RNA-directed DNA polymerase